MNKLVLYGAVLLNILLLIGGQLIWKQALNAMNGLSVVNVITSPGVWIGGFLYVIATGLWFVILNNMKLSVAYPMQSLAYVFGLLAAWAIFSETIPTTRWIGVGVILLGVYLVSLD